MAPVTQGHKSGKSITEGSRSYKEVISFLDSLKPIDHDKKTVDRMKQLDKLFGNISQKIPAILVGGTNGKSSTIHFASKLLKEEGQKVGIAYSSHILNYNERVYVDDQAIQNKTFADTVNEVITMAQAHKIEATAYELMTIASLLYFKTENVTVALIEIGLGGKYDAANIFSPKVVAITRVAQDESNILGEDLDEITFNMLEVAKSGTWVVSAEQSKIRLNKMKKWAEERGINWAMPIRKLASLPYIYEQLYGRTASLGERIAQVYIEDVCKKFSPFLRGNLLATKKGHRGRPTLEAKRNAELNPIKTLKKFWHNEFSLLPGRFELLNKEKPSVLLDNADNLDAFNNTFLGIRLLHYQHPLKDLSMIIGLPICTKMVESIKLIRYLLKKVSGQAIFVPIPNRESHDPQDLTKLAKELGVKAKAFDSFAKAFDSIKEAVDEREGLIVVTGHQSLISEYWKHRGIKKV
ncbi:hypothetical protein KKA53_03070 [Candidatus Dependentiae bacterium]|nr:hypothetical protein [Candidatus Dependentiae bacterium]